MLRLSQITKRFPGVDALSRVDFSLEAGEIRALMGENGAGKSTLIKVLTGVYPADEGRMFLEHRAPSPSAPSPSEGRGGEGISLRSPAEAQALGISTVYQEVNLAPNLSVAENICLGDEPRRWGLIDWQAMRTRAKAALDRLGLTIDARTTLNRLSIAEQQLVAIARAFDRKSKILVLDEPTSSLDAAETARLFDLLRQLKSEGIAILFVTHFIGQVYELCDSITVLRNGQKVGDFAVAECSPANLIAAMIGHEIDTGQEVTTQASYEGKAEFEFREIGRNRVMEPTSLSLAKGEIKGLAGLLGSGRTELMKLIYGAMRAVTGNAPSNPAAAIRAGTAFCPEDRKGEGIFPGLSVLDNMILALQTQRGLIRRIGHARQAEIAGGMIAKLGIKTPDANRPIELLSGGNQQKVLLARWLIMHPRLLILDEPTRGIDIGSKEEIKRLIRDEAAGGMACLFTSSEIEEVVEVCSSVLVLRDRRPLGEIAGADLTVDGVVKAIAGEAA